MMSLSTKIAALSLAAFLIVGCGKDEKNAQPNAAAAAASNKAAEEKATLEYFTGFFATKTPQAEGLLSTKAAAAATKVAKLHGKDVNFEGELRLNPDKKFVFNFIPAMPPADDHEHDHADVEECEADGHDHASHGPTEVKGQWKVEGGQLVLDGLGTLEKAKEKVQQAETKAAKLTFKGSVGHFTVAPVLFTFETRQAPAPAAGVPPMIPPAVDGPQQQRPSVELTPAQVAQLKAWVARFGVHFSFANRVVEAWVAEQVRYTFDVTRDAIRELVERARRQQQQRERRQRQDPKNKPPVLE